MQRQTIFLGAVLVIAALSLLSTALAQGGVSNIFRNAIGLMDLESARVVVAAGRTGKVSLNCLYAGIAAGVLVSAVLETLGSARYFRTLLKRVMFSVIIGMVTYSHVVHALFCNVDDTSELIGYFAVAFAVGFTMDELIFKLLRIAEKIHLRA
jgi:hypothetical protein